MGARISVLLLFRIICVNGFYFPNSLQIVYLSLVSIYSVPGVLTSQLTTDSLVRLLFFLRASNISHICFSSIPEMLFRFTSFTSSSSADSLARTDLGSVALGGSGSKYCRGLAYASIMKFCGLVLRISARAMTSSSDAAARASSSSRSNLTLSAISAFFFSSVN